MTWLSPVSKLQSPREGRCQISGGGCAESTQGTTDPQHLHMRYLTPNCTWQPLTVTECSSRPTSLHLASVIPEECSCEIGLLLLIVAFWAGQTQADHIPWELKQSNAYCHTCDTEFPIIRPQHAIDNCLQLAHQAIFGGLGHMLLTNGRGASARINDDADRLCGGDLAAGSQMLYKADQAKQRQWICCTFRKLEDLKTLHTAMCDTK